MGLYPMIQCMIFLNSFFSPSVVLSVWTLWCGSTYCDEIRHLCSGKRFSFGSLLTLTTCIFRDIIKEEETVYQDKNEWETSNRSTRCLFIRKVLHFYKKPIGLLVKSSAGKALCHCVDMHSSQINMSLSVLGLKVSLH